MRSFGSSKLTAVSSSPATTCALVTTTPGEAIQPEPDTARPHAVPSTRTTLSAAALTSGSAASLESGGPTVTFGPGIAIAGSILLSALRKPPEGGKRFVQAPEDLGALHRLDAAPWRPER